MAGPGRAEAVVATHVENALELAWLLKGVMTVNAATDHYMREFGLPAGVAQMVMQRVQARVAADELTAQVDEPLAPSPARGAAAGFEERAAGFAEPATGRSVRWRVRSRLASELESHRQIEVGSLSRSPSPAP